MIESERIINGKPSIARRHCISTLTVVKHFAQTVRAHWGVENSLHWVLFKENDSCICTSYTTENFNIICQLAINLLKKEPSKMSMKKKHFETPLNDAFSEAVIFLT